MLFILYLPSKTQQEQRGRVNVMKERPWTGFKAVCSTSWNSDEARACLTTVATAGAGWTPTATRPCQGNVLVALTPLSPAVRQRHCVQTLSCRCVSVNFLTHRQLRQDTRPRTWGR